MAPLLVSVILGLLTPATLVSATDVGIGPVAVHIESEGDPVNYDYNNGATPTNPGDDELDVFQTIYSIDATLDLNHFERFSVPFPGAQSTSYKINFRETRIEHPFWSTAEHLDESVYDEYVPAEVQTRFGIEFYDEWMQFTLNVDTPVYQNNYCENRCRLPYFGNKDSQGLPAGVWGVSTDAAVELAPFTLGQLCHPEALPYGEPCPGPIDPLDLAPYYHLTPNMSVGYEIHNASGTINGTPDNAGGPSPESEDSPREPNVATSHGTAPAGVSEPLAAKAPATAAEIPLWRRPGSAVLTESSGTIATPPTHSSVPAQDLLLITTLAALALAPILFLYHRLRRDQVLNHTIRAQIFDLVCQEPGIHERELARRLGLKRQLVDYHAKHLARVGAITIRKVGNQKCLFQNGGKYIDVEQKVLSVVKRGRTADVLATLANAREPLSQREIATAVGIHESSVKWHLERLAALGLVHVTRDGRGKFARIDEYARGVVEASVKPRGFLGGAIEAGPRAAAPRDVEGWSHESA